MLGIVVHFIFAVNFLIARIRAHVEATDGENLFLSTCLAMTEFTFSLLELMSEKLFCHS